MSCNVGAATRTKIYRKPKAIIYENELSYLASKIPNLRRVHTHFTFVLDTYLTSTQLSNTFATCIRCQSLVMSENKAPPGISARAPKPAPFGRSTASEASVPPRKSVSRSSIDNPAVAKPTASPAPDPFKFGSANATQPTTSLTDNSFGSNIAAPTKTASSTFQKPVSSGNAATTKNEGSTSQKAVSPKDAPASNTAAASSPKPVSTTDAAVPQSAPSASTATRASNEKSSMRGSHQVNRRTSHRKRSE